MKRESILVFVKAKHKKYNCCQAEYRGPYLLIVQLSFNLMGALDESAEQVYVLLILKLHVNFVCLHTETLPGSDIKTKSIFELIFKSFKDKRIQTITKSRWVPFCSTKNWRALRRQQYLIYTYKIIKQPVSIDQQRNRKQFPLSWILVCRKPYTDYRPLIVWRSCPQISFHHSCDLLNSSAAERFLFII